MINERGLWAAVLLQAIIDLGSWQPTPRALTNGRNSRSPLRYVTRLWFESKKYEPGSFLWICDFLDLDATTVRRRAFQIAEQGICLEPEELPGAGA